eukprot:SAG31_NODE_2133_length_6372_cov_4.372071_3_plen_72_part_00
MLALALAMRADHRPNAGVLIALAALCISCSRTTNYIVLVVEHELIGMSRGIMQGDKLASAVMGEVDSATTM